MPKIIIYTTPTCVYCRKAKAFFEANKIAYEEKDVAHDEEAAHEMIHKSGQFGVPVIDIDGEIVVGFDQPELSQLIGIK